MPLDNPADFISGINPVNPLGTDPKSEGDDTLRILKNNIVNTLPNFDELITKTSDDVNNMAQKNLDEVINGAAFRQWTFQDMIINVSSLDSVDIPVGYRWRRASNTRWELLMEVIADNRDLRLTLSDDSGVFINFPYRINATTGLIDFALTPTVAGDVLALLDDVDALKAEILFGGVHRRDRTGAPTSNTFGLHFPTVVSNTIPPALGSVSDTAANGFQYTANIAQVATMVWGGVESTFGAGITLNKVTSVALSNNDDAGTVGFTRNQEDSPVATVSMLPGDVLRPHNTVATGGAQNSPNFVTVTAHGLA